MKFFEYKNFYLVGIKGVAMTSLAQLLIDAGKQITGSDVSEDFVTKKILSSLNVKIDTTFDAAHLEASECVIYTAAHQGKFNPQVTAAREKNIPIFSHAEALAQFFNQKKGIAVCGVGGKSTISAMITWIMEKNNSTPSFSVGVGQIIGMQETGRWNNNAEYFVAEADEYVTDPAAVAQGETPIARFSYLHPYLTVCTHIQYDHPDVYASEAETIATYQKFFNQIDQNGVLLLNEQDSNRNLSTTAAQQITFGTSANATLQYKHLPQTSSEGITRGTFTYDNVDYPVELMVPGEYNLENAAAATLACIQLGISIEHCILALQSFASTMRRYEFKGEINGVRYYDDYGHHPSEIAAVIDATYQWFPSEKVVIAFQPHTYTRTKHLFTEFVEVLSKTRRLLVLDIFASAREEEDPSITSEQLAKAIREKNPSCEVIHLSNVDDLANYCKVNLKAGDICLTVGAGDIYHVHDILKEA